MCTDKEDLPCLHAETKILKAKLKLGNNHLPLMGPSWAADSTAFCVAQRPHPHVDAPQESWQTSLEFRQEIRCCLIRKKRGPHVDVIHCDHGVPCVGYRLSLVKDKLNPEYANFPGREIGTRMKKWSCGDRASQIVIV